MRSERHLAAEHHELGNALLVRRDFDGARQAFERAIWFAPGFAAGFNGLGAALHGKHDLFGAIDAFRAALELNAEYGEAADNLSVVLRERGNMDEAKQWSLRAIALEPRNGRFLRHLADHEPVRADSAVAEQLESAAAIAEQQPLDIRIETLFGYAKVLSDLGRLGDAFTVLVRANRLRRQSIAYDEASMLRSLDSLIDSLDRPFVDATRDCGDPSTRPIFIVGMPRSGTTLVEALLAAHPDVRAGGELMAFEDGIALMPRIEAGSSVAELRNALRKLGEAYIRETDAAATGALHLTDKMPFNFRFIPVIRAALPNARIIHVRRNALDVAFSCFATLFFYDIPFTYDLGELGRYYGAYERLMAAWTSLAPQGAILDLEYEAIVADVRTQARRLLAFCGLDWHNNVLRFHESRHPVSSASQTQVRRPLYATSVGRGEALRPHLEPFERAREGCQRGRA
ncbi:MAG: sulfotransferase [Candidatus Aquilonibacter sp.]|jgi:tetratricopeptide (TPR) repeat protein